MLQRAPSKYLHKLPPPYGNVPCHSLPLIAALCSSTAFCLIPVSDFQLSPPPLANEEIPVLQHARKQNVVVNPQADIGQLSSARLSPPHFTKSEYDTDPPPVSYAFIESTPPGRKKKKKSTRIIQACKSKNSYALITTPEPSKDNARYRCWYHSISSMRISFFSLLCTAVLQCLQSLPTPV